MKPGDLSTTGTVVEGEFVELLGRIRASNLHGVVSFEDEASLTFVDGRLVIVGSKPTAGETSVARDELADLLAGLADYDGPYDIAPIIGVAGAGKMLAYNPITLLRQGEAESSGPVNRSAPKVAESAQPSQSDAKVQTEAAVASLSLIHI